MRKYIAFGLTLETDINFTGVLQETTAKTDVLITEEPVPEKANRQTRIYRRGVQAKFGRTDTGLLLNWAGIGKFRMSAGKEIVYQNLGADEGTMRLFLLSEVVGLILFQRGLFLLHGSAVRVGNEARVFLGVPGAGKSTTAAAFGKAGNTVLTDDLVAIQLIDNTPFVVPAFSQYKIWERTVEGLDIDRSVLEPSFEGATKFLVTQPIVDFPQQPISLRSITLLYPPNSRRKNERIKPLRAPIELLHHFPLPVQLLKADYLQKHFQDALHIARVAEIHQMKRPDGFAALDEFVQTS